MTRTANQGRCTREGWEQLWIVQRWQCVSNRTDKIYAKNKQTQQFMMTRIFVIARERGPILLGNAACQWLGLIAVLVENKAPVVGRFVAAVTREETECGETEAYPLENWWRCWNDQACIKNTLSHWSSQEEEDTDLKGKIGGKCFRPLDVTLESTPSESQPSAPERTEPTAHKSKTRSFQEVYHKQNPVLKWRGSEKRE